MPADASAVKLVLAESGTAIGGTERVVWELATRLPRARYEVEVWLSPDPGVDTLASSLEEREIVVRRVPEVTSRWDLRTMLSTWRLLRRVRPDLLHVHHVWPAADRYLASIADAAGVKHLVITEHIVGESHSAGQRALKRRELDGADAVTAVSAAVAESLRADYGLDPVRVKVVPNGADPPDEQGERAAMRRYRESLGAGMLRPLWVCVGRLERQKGQDVLLEALAMLRQRGIDFVCAFAGDGSTRAALEARREALGLGAHARFLGQVEDPGPLLAAADAVVLPSRWEGLPLVVLEALARGRPVVASGVGGIPEVIEDGVEGRLVPPDDATALAAALEDCFRRSDVAQSMGRRGARLIQDRYTWPRVVENFETVYDEVLGLAAFDVGRRGRGKAAR
jgi:glycosyltransferase involved in cell wall biosynthesis